jgi:hypothetical protein
VVPCFGEHGNHKKPLKTQSASHYWGSRRHILLVASGFALGYVLFDEELLVGVTCIMCLWTIKLILKKMKIERSSINYYIENTMKTVEESGVETQLLNYTIGCMLLCALIEGEELQVLHINNIINEYMGSRLGI